MFILTNTLNDMKQKTALITGVTGQDGALLAEFLLKQNYRVIAPTRQNPDKSNLLTLDIHSDENLKFLTYESWSDFDKIIKHYQPQEIYHLAAMSHVGQSHENPEMVFNVNTHWTVNLLQAIKIYSPQTKFFFASSCEIYNSTIDRPVVETDEKLPSNPYGISKLSAHLMVEYYRKVKGLFACNGILFNHESKLRAPSFVSKKICREVARIVTQGGKPLSLGNIEAKKDWGYAPDYIKMFQAMLQQPKPDDYIISTGELHSVKDMVNCAFAALNYKIYWHGTDLECQALNANNEVVVNIDERFFRPLDNRFLIGNNSKAKQYLNFSNSTPFSEWVKLMTLNELIEEPIN
jgi:GDPmannose 4,6-dehydratase